MRDGGLAHRPALRPTVTIHEKLPQVDYVHYLTDTHVYASSRNHILRRGLSGGRFERVATLPVRSGLDRLLLSHKLSRRAGRKRIENIAVLPSRTIIAIMDGSVFRIDGAGAVTRVFQMARCRGTLHGGVAIDARGDLYVGEYWRNPRRTSVEIFRGTNDGTAWSRQYASPAKRFRHYHGCFYDRWEDCLWFTTGDLEGENYIGRSDPAFTAVQYIGDGSKAYSAVNLLITETFIYFANDNPYGPNYIRRMHKKTRTFETLQAINGPAWYGYQTSDGWMLFASTVEYSTTTRDGQGHLYLSRDGREWCDAFTWRKDPWRPWSVFQFGIINFPGGAPTTSASVWLSGQAFRDCDLSVWRVSAGTDGAGRDATGEAPRHA